MCTYLCTFCMVHNVLFFMLNIPFQVFQRCSSLLSLIFFIFYILTKRVHCELFQVFFLFPQILLPPFSVVLGIHVVPRAIKLHSRIQCLTYLTYLYIYWLQIFFQFCDSTIGIHWFPQIHEIHHNINFKSFCWSFSSCVETIIYIWTIIFTFESQFCSYSFSKICFPLFSW